MEQKPAPQNTAPHFAGARPGEHFAVAPGMRFRKPDGAVVVVPQLKHPSP